MNAGTIAATVEVTLLTDSGVQQGLSDAITVGPGPVPLGERRPVHRGSQVQALHVQTSSGQVAAAVWQGPASGSGGAWLPQASAPGKQLVISGLTTASSAARLFIAVPGPVDARVAVTALTAHGRYVPFGHHGARRAVRGRDLIVRADLARHVRRRAGADLERADHRGHRRAGQWHRAPSAPPPRR